ncbi:hypothetical protein FRB96_006748 [Tulasnella sp. 330]|nr:hypothetical protein FRB96_006748 [Tulasnella sp. 330]
MDRHSWLFPLLVPILRIFWSIKMYLQRLGQTYAPAPITHRFTKTISSTFGRDSGTFDLIFYTPNGFGDAANAKKRYPCIVNLHGGGFVLGSATDDARWATAVVQQTDSVVCSVEYRRSHEHPWPTAVEDCVDAINHVWLHAEDLGIDREKIGVSGFGAGGNLAFSASLRLHDELVQRRLARPGQYPEIKIVLSFYPSTDHTRSHDQRHASCPRPEPPYQRRLNQLFEACYFYPSNNFPRNSPFVSPAKASDKLLQSALPEAIAIYTAEGDLLSAEGEYLRKRLKMVGKDVSGQKVMGVGHAFDREIYVTPVVKEMYGEACEKIREVFYETE